jgi:hypothetical protein
MSKVVIENSSSPFDEPRRHFPFSDNGITNQIDIGRRTNSYFIPIVKVPPVPVVDDSTTGPACRELWPRIREYFPKKGRKSDAVGGESNRANTADLHLTLPDSTLIGARTNFSVGVSRCPQIGFDRLEYPGRNWRIGYRPLPGGDPHTKAGHSDRPDIVS